MFTSEGLLRFILARILVSSLTARLPVVLWTLFLTLVIWVGGVQAAHAQEAWTALPTISTTSDTGEKPQSKVWFHAHTWWAVLPSNAPSPAGSWLFRLEPDLSWTPVLQVSSSSGKADTKAVGNITHVLLVNSNSQLVTLEYIPASDTYQLWSGRPTPTPVYVGETGTIDVDSTGRMWLATDFNGTVEAFYSDYPYSSFLGPTILATNLNSDDIVAVAALPNNTIGVLWSNQNTQRFGFRAHEDGADPAAWLDDEVPASASAVNDGVGMADDHLNFAVAADGTLYAAVKTGYSSSSLPTLGLLVRHPDPGGPGGTWDNLYFVNASGTRPIVLLNEDTQTLRVFYTSTSPDNVYFRESAAATISFGPVQTLMGGGLNNATSTKDRWAGRLVILASNGVTHGVLITSVPGLVGYWKMDDGGGTQARDMSGWGNHANLVGNPIWVPGVNGLAIDFDGAASYAVVSDQAGLDITAGLTLAAWIKPGTQANQDLISKSVLNSVDGYALSLSAAASPTSPGTAFVQFNQATLGNSYRLDSLTPYPFSGNVWMHVAATYNGTTMRIYVNGVQKNFMPGPTAIAANALGVGIGAQSNGARKFRGKMDEVRTYERALTAAEIAALAAMGPVEADLTISKNDSLSSVSVGQLITYTVQVANLGPANVASATVTDLLPAQLTAATWTCIASTGASCTASGSGNLNDLVNLPAGSNVSYTLQATVASGAGGTLTNTATVVASSANDPVSSNNSSTDVDSIQQGGTGTIDAHFDGGPDGFSYADDLFRGTTQPSYASGVHLATGGFTGGALQVSVGGVNSSTILNMSGGWQRSFSLASPTLATLSFRYQLTETPNYEVGEFTQMLVKLDGVLYGVPPNDYVAQVIGTGPTTTGWQLVQITLGTLPAGTHVLALGGYNNQKTYTNESAEVRIDDLLLTTGTAGPVAPSITTPPGNVTVTAPAAATFTVVASGTAPLSYQWRRNGSVISGATSATYVTNATTVAADNGAQFVVVVSNSAGSITSAPAATLTVLGGGGTAPTILDAHFDAGPDGFSYADDLFRGTTQPSYASGVHLAAGGFTGGALQVNVGGVNSQTILNMSGGWQRSFSLASPTLVTLSFRYLLTETPNYEIGELTQMLVSINGGLYGVPPNDYVAQVVGTGPTTTGWQLVQITLGTLPAGTHVLTLGAYNNQKTYTNESAEVRIDDLLLTASGSPSITTPPGNVTVTAPATATFTVLASGTAPLSYQWWRNGSAISGATNATYVTNPTTVVADNGAQFVVVVSNSAGSITSAPAATLTVLGGGGTPTTILDAHFDGGPDGFSYADDLFRGTTQPSYASGVHLATGGFTGGALQVSVGGVNSSTILNMSGGWQRSFSLASPTLVTLSFRYLLTETPNYEIGELTQMLVSIDGGLYGVPPNDYVAQVVGTGPTTTGWQLVQITLGTLPAGTHVLALGGYNNQKTYTNESAEVRIDDVSLTF